MWCPNRECPDALESGSPSEFVDGMISCPFCGAELVSYEPARADAADPEIRLVPVMQILNEIWLPKVKSILDDAGVRYVVQDAGVHFIRRAPVVMVEEGDLDRATALLNNFKAEMGLDPAGESLAWTPPAWQPSACPQCGKTLESGEDDETLAYCYHCGAPLSSETAGEH